MKLQHAVQDRIQREVDFIREVSEGITSALADINDITTSLSHSEEQRRLNQR
jgi:hypothetical protein